MLRDKEFYRALGERIRKTREDKKYTQEYVAKKSDLSVKFLSDVENGVKGISTENFCKIAKILGVSCDYLIYGCPSDIYINKLCQEISRLEDSKQKCFWEIAEHLYKSMKNN